MTIQKKGLTVAELRARLKGTGWVLELASGYTIEATKYRKRRDPYAGYESIVVSAGDGGHEDEARLRLAEMVEKVESKP